MSDVHGEIHSSECELRALLSGLGLFEQVMLQCYGEVIRVYPARIVEHTWDTPSQQSGKQPQSMKVH